MLVSAPKSGKIAAFALPMLQVLNRNPTEHSRIRVLILASTDELCLEIESKLKVYSKYVTFYNFGL
jgi:ATP-dependent RNA helicase RhlE